MSLKNSFRSFVTGTEMGKISFKDEILYISDNIYVKPDIMNDQVQTIIRDKIVKIDDNNSMIIEEDGSDWFMDEK